MTNKLTTIRPQKANANKHTQRGLGMLEQSIQRDGWIGAITVAADGESFDGSARIEVGVATGFDDAIVVRSKGDRPIVHIREDIPNADDPRAKRLGVAANRVASVDLDWNTDILADLNTEGVLDGLFYEDELADLLASVGDEQEQYSRKIEAPIYEPKGVKPKVSELYDSVKAEALQADIQSADFLTDDERVFLTIAARRHTVLHYNKIADFYAHSSEAVQRLMENSALVIIDFNRAIELGYVKLTEDIAKQYGADYPDE